MFTPLLRFVGVFESGGLVEDGVLWGGVLVKDVVAGTLKLDGDAGIVLKKG